MSQIPLGKCWPVKATGMPSEADLARLMGTEVLPVVVDRVQTSGNRRPKPRGMPAKVLAILTRQPQTAETIAARLGVTRKVARRAASDILRWSDGTPAEAVMVDGAHGTITAWRLK